VPLTLIAGIGHWLLGSVNWLLLSSLLIGSLPGVYIGSHFAALVPDRILRRDAVAGGHKDVAFARIGCPGLTCPLALYARHRHFSRRGLAGRGCTGWTVPIANWKAQFGVARPGHARDAFLLLPADASMHLLSGVDSGRRKAALPVSRYEPPIPSAGFVTRLKLD
jgi:hypothetical protein